MKKKIIFSNCIFLLSLLACTNELKEETSSLNTIPIDVINLEEAFPNKTKETVTLQNGISFERYNDLIIWGGDMIISEKMFNSFNNPTQTRGGIVNNPDFKWPNGIVYYKFDSAISKTTKEHIQQAMDEWKQSTSKIITFTERTSQKNYIKFINAFRESNTISLLFSSNNCIFLFSLSVIGSTVFTVFESIVAITKLSCSLSFSHCTKIQYAMYINSVSKIFFISNLIRDVDNWAFLSSRLLFF